MSQKQRNESNSLSPHGPPFTDISCGFFLTLSLTHSTERKARFMFWGKKEKAREREGGEEGGEAESSSTFTLPLSAGVRGSGKQGVCFARCFYFKKEKIIKIKKKPSLFVRRKGTPKSFRVLGEKKKEKKIWIRETVHSSAPHHSSRFSCQCFLFTKSSTGVRS